MYIDSMNSIYVQTHAQMFLQKNYTRKKNQTYNLINYCESCTRLITSDRNGAGVNKNFVSYTYTMIQN